METPHALVKDLRSTGYFFNELKSYSQSSEIDLETYCTGFAVPYLLRVSESYDKSGRSPRSRILMLAIKHLSDPSEGEIVDSIFGIKKIAETEIKKTSKTTLEQQPDKSRSLADRQGLESATFLVKLLVNIIKMFRLAEPNAYRRKADEAGNPVFDAILQSWEVLERGDT
ncbi:MAG TPA: hypothetical protein VEF34_10075 [Syntrophobacteraceae bacterium]|nr:hypothetical protein [Syntrophobacteraceae bacterium]